MVVKDSVLNATITPPTFDQHLLFVNGWRKKTGVVTIRTEYIEQILNRQNKEKILKHNISKEEPDFSVKVSQTPNISTHMLLALPDHHNIISAIKLQTGQRHWYCQ